MRPALTTELAEDFLRLLRLGNYVSTACSVVGIHRDTYYGWLERGRQGDEPYKSFRRDVRKAMAEAEVRDLATIQAASREQWQAAAWRLERRFPKKWGRKVETKNEVQVREVKLPHNLQLLSPAEARVYLRALAKMAENPELARQFDDAADALEGAAG